MYQRKTLREWAQQADVVVVAEISSALRVWSADDGSDHQEYFSVRVVEAVAGEPVAGSFDIFPHAEGEPAYRPGDRALVFLDRTAARAEFANLATRFPYFTTQGAGYEWKVVDGDGGEVVAVARAWREIGSGAGYAERRDLLLRELESSNRRLRAEAIADMVRLRESIAADAPTVARLTTTLRSDRFSVGERIGLIHILSGAPGFAAGAETLRLAAAAGADGDAAAHLAVVRAAGVQRDAEVTAWLRQQLAGGDVGTRRAALIALGHPWHAAAVADIAAACAADDDPRVAAAAVRALGAIGNRDAVASLRALAARDQRPLSALARAELQRLERRD